MQLAMLISLYVCLSQAPLKSVVFTEWTPFLRIKIMITIACEMLHDDIASFKVQYTSSNLQQLYML